MKKSGKISINPEKVIKNEELVNLKGGYYGPCTCTCYDTWTYECLGYLASDTGNCLIECNDFYGGHVGGSCGNLDICEPH
ncbi:MAG TPA: TIGR04149 family rSAM-modified RiPP [Draconibacterium sp.]|nr:TIGR04149 family rSAM-modified RiPP [Draconibacterium sp.]